VKSPRLQAFTIPLIISVVGKMSARKKKCFIGSITSKQICEGGGATAFGWGLWSLMAVGMGQCDIYPEQQIEQQLF
jgi:hypothetical protein